MGTKVLRSYYHSAQDFYCNVRKWQKDQYERWRWNKWHVSLFEVSSDVIADISSNEILRSCEHTVPVRNIEKSSFECQCAKKNAPDWYSFALKKVIYANMWETSRTIFLMKISNALQKKEERNCSGFPRPNCIHMVLDKRQRDISEIAGHCSPQASYKAAHTSERYISNSE